MPIDISHSNPNHEEVADKGVLERMKERVAEAVGEVLEAMSDLVAPQPELRPVRVRPVRRPPPRRRR